MKFGNIDIKKIYYGSRLMDSTSIYLGTLPMIEDEPEPFEWEGLTFTALEDSEIALLQNRESTAPEGAKYYTSINGAPWQEYTIGDSINVPTGSKLYWKGNYKTGEANQVYKYFSGSGSVDVSGDISSLLFGEDYETSTYGEGYNHAYCNLFRNLTALHSAEDLTWGNIENVQQREFVNMFYGCSNLVKVPVSLPSAPIVDTKAYASMFNGCASLTTAPELPATYLNTYCYESLFIKCTSLTAAPELPATDLANYCYKTMFSGCSLLNEVKLYAETDISGTATQDWLLNVAETGTIYNYGGITLEADSASGIPTGWTVEYATA